VSTLLGLFGSHRVLPATQTPWQLPATHVWVMVPVEHGMGEPTLPLASHGRTELELGAQVLTPGLQATQLPARHAGVFPVQLVCVIHMPSTHDWMALPRH
jgi:hypothetical protein